MGLVTCPGPQSWQLAFEPRAVFAIRVIFLTAVNCVGVLRGFSDDNMAHGLFCPSESQSAL